MADLNNTLIRGNLRVINDAYFANLADISAGTIKINKVLAPTTSGGTTYSAGTNGQLLVSNGTSVYWSTVSYSLQSKTATQTGAIAYLDAAGLSFTAASITGTTKVGSETHTHSIATSSVGIVRGTAPSLTSNDTASGGIAYIASATAPALSASAAPNGHTHSYNTYTLAGINASGTTKYMKFSAGTTPPSGAAPAHTSTASGANSGTAVSAVTGYPNFSGGSGSFTATRTTEGDARIYAHRRLTITHSHTAASLGTPSKSNAAPNSHTHSYDKTTSITFTAGTAPSMNFNTGTSTDTPYIASMTNGTISLTTNANAGTSGANSGTAVTLSGGVHTTKYLHFAAGTTPISTVSISSATTGGPSATTTVATAISGGSLTKTNKYLVLTQGA